MKRLCIHRGSCTYVEIEAQGKLTMLDFGVSLNAPDADSVTLHPVV